MHCLDDPTDELIQSIDYGRWAEGTKQLNGSIANMDSSGDVSLFCRGLLKNLLLRHGDRFKLVPDEEVTNFEVDEKNLFGVTSRNQNGDFVTRQCDKIVLALGVRSAELCNSIGVSCPVYPAKGHLVTVSSRFDYKYNIALRGGVGYAAPMAITNSEGRRLYRLSGFVDFTPDSKVNHERVDALVDAARADLPDLEIIDSSACHRPLSADDRALIGPTKSYPGLFLCTGFGSRGWSIGLGAGKLLAIELLGLKHDIDPSPYLPSRFN